MTRPMKGPMLKMLAAGMSVCMASSSWAAEAVRVTQAAEVAASRVTVPPGTVIVVRLRNEINSKTVKTGDTIDFIVSDDVTIRGKVVVKQGTGVQGQVTKAKKAESVGEPGELVFSVPIVQAVDGTAIPINFSKSAEGESKQDKSIILTILCCFLFLLKKGEDVGFAANTIFTAYTLTPVEVTVQ